MKRQGIESKYGFTLFELMVVIAIFGVFVAATSVFNYTPQTEMEKADRLLNSVVNKIKSEIQNVSIGRMPIRDGRVANYINMTISTGGITSLYYTGSSGTVPIMTGSFVMPFFDQDRLYEIKSVTWTGSATVPLGYSGAGNLIIEPTGISFTGVGIYGSGFTLLEVKVGYGGRSRKYILDRRTGKSTEVKVY